MVDNVIIDGAVSMGFKRIPSYLTEIASKSGGYEVRNQRWSQPRRRYQFDYGPRAIATAQAVSDLFDDRRGRLKPFLLKDWSDYQLTAEVIGQGDGSTGPYQIIKSYGSSNPLTRTIEYIKSGTLSATVDGSAAGIADETLGEITFSSAAGSGLDIAVTCEFYVPVRFDADEFAIATQLAASGLLADISGLTAIEVIGE